MSRFIDWLSRPLLTATLGLLAAPACQLVIGIKDTKENPDAVPSVDGSTVHLRLNAQGIVSAVNVRVVADGVNKVMPVPGDGQIDLGTDVAVGGNYAVSLEGTPTCALSSNAAGTASAAVDVDLFCQGVTRLSALTLSSARTPALVFAPATLAYTFPVSELQPTTDVTATTAFASATLSINGASAISGVAKLQPLAFGSNTVTVAVTHPASPILTSTYTINVDRSVVLQSTFADAPFGAAFDAIGWTVATDGDRIVVGAPNEDSDADPSTANASASQSGAAYVYVRNGAAWQYEDFVKAPNAEASDLFGNDVDISGNWVIVGAPFEDSGSAAQGNNDVSSAGAAYMYERVGANWVFRQYLKGPAGSYVANGYFGYAVAIDGDTAVVGAYGNTANTNQVLGGQVYVYRLNNAVWSLEATLQPDAVTGAIDLLGFSVAIDGDTIVAGGAKGSAVVSSAGMARVYRRTGTTWALDQGGTLLPPTGRANDFFGNAVSIHGDTAVIAAPELMKADGSDPSNTPGTAYVYTRSASGWNPTPFVLTASNGDADDEFGRSVEIDGDLIAVAAYGEDGDANGVTASVDSANAASNSGAVYLYRRQGATWVQTRYIKDDASTTDDQFGTSLALARGVLVIGTGGQDTPVANAGAFSVVQ